MGVLYIFVVVSFSNLSKKKKAQNLLALAFRILIQDIQGEDGGKESRETDKERNVEQEGERPKEKVKKKDSKVLKNLGLQGPQPFRNYLEKVLEITKIDETSFCGFFFFFY